ncbi:mechanosensitive ion channel family protein [Tateyamaria pelophila]|uniref:mechanosensitive ion channel family protein n=1 Tax=Tateyamaria pelophila TaxID=328415 RepID=UPI001CBAE86E|nr:mechanosensitive ion channel family protein [Tateyamaria pelophila]
MAFFRFLLVASVSLFCASQVVAQVANQGIVASESDPTLEGIETAEITPVRTESPRSTLQSLYNLRDDLETSLGAYWQQQNTTNAVRIAFVIDQIRALIDLSQVPLVTRREIGTETAFSLLDILGRVKAIDAAALPGPDDLDDQPTNGFRLPGTPLRLVEITEGDRAGEYLFSSETVSSAARFSAGLRTLPLRSSLPIISWGDMNRQLTGPWIPNARIAKLPGFLRHSVFDTPIWKIFFVILFSGATAVVLRIWHRLLVVTLTSDPVNVVRLRILSPIAIMVAMLWLGYVFSFQVNTTGRFFDLIQDCLVVVFFFAATWAFWAISRAFFETVIVDPRRTNRSLDDSFIRLVGQIIGFIGGVLILGYGAHELGVPVLSMIAGFGIGGCRVAFNCEIGNSTKSTVTLCP